jgi:hypothetical protein
MDEFRKVLSEIADQEAFERWKSGRAPLAEQLPPRSARLLSAVRTELLHVSVLTAVMAGLASHIERGQAGAAAVFGLGTYAPAHSEFFRRSLETLFGEALATEQAAELQCYLARIDLAIRLARAFTAAPATGGSEAGADIEILADAWRRTAAEASRAIETVSAAMGRPLAAGTDEEASRVLGLLRMSEAGHSPCLGPDGRVTIPGWAERRRALRRTVALPASVVVAGEALFVGAVVRDISATGLGVDCACDAAEGTPVTVRIDGGRQFHGRVAWSNGQRLGIELDQRLAPDDSLLQTN